MANKKNIIVCWNDNGNKKDLEAAFSGSEDYNIKVFTSFNCFSQLGKTTKDIKESLKNYGGIVVLCELQWSHNKTNAPFSEFQGITLVQRYLRDTLGLKIPVVFTSFLDAKEIVSPKLKPQLRPDAGIIMTPALQHRFVRLPVAPQGLLAPFKEMRRMSDTELVYTRMQYCDYIGLLRQIKHNAEGRQINEQEPFRKQLEYVINKQFGGALDYAELLKNCKQTSDISAFCDKLINRLMTPEDSLIIDNIIDFDFACKDESDQISILILEDDHNDENVHRFISYINRKNEEYKKKNRCFLFKEPKIVENKDDFEWYVQYGTRSVGGKYDVIICDIEIKNAEGFLVSLGFNLVDAIVTLRKKPIYYIVTNVSRSFYDQIKKEYISRIRLKKEVFGTNESIRMFLYGIKEGYVQKELNYGDAETTPEKLFNDLIKFTKNNTYSFKYKNPKTGETRILENYAAIEDVVKARSTELIKMFLAFFFRKGFEGKPGDMSNYKTFNDNCILMREYIKKYVGIGNERWVKEYDEYSDFKQSELSNFTKRLILRRFYFYVREFVKYYSITDSANAIQKLCKSKRKISDRDIACRAINTDCKALNVSMHNKDLEKGYKGQTHCFDVVLLFSEKRDPEDKYYTVEEIEFLKTLLLIEKVFCYSDKGNIETLNLYEYN
jgi:hypothetical protein